MSAVPPTADDLLWGLIDAAGAVRSRALLQKTVFLGQEYGLIPSVFGFPVWPGIGTACHSEELEEALARLLGSEKVFDTGGPASIKALQHAPDPARQAASKLARRLNGSDEALVSLMAAYVMAQHREKQDGVRGSKRLRKQAACRLGWPGNIVELVEDGLADLARASGE